MPPRPRWKPRFTLVPPHRHLPTPTSSPPDHRHRVERYSLMATVICTRFPDKAKELFVYQASIVWAKHNYEGKRWVTYDRQYRCEALARKDLNWSVTNPRIYNEAFTSNCPMWLLPARRPPNQCPRNPHRPIFGWFPDPALLPAHPLGAFTSQPSPNRGQPSEVCRRYNEGRCRYSRCRYRHQCSNCGGPHTWVSCPRNTQAQPTLRSRSPGTPYMRNPTGPAAHLPQVPPQH